MDGCSNHEYLKLAAVLSTKRYGPNFTISSPSTTLAESDPCLPLLALFYSPMSSSSSPHRVFTESPETLFARRLKTRIDSVEVAVRDVFEYAQLCAQHLADTLGKDPQYYLGIIFDRGTFIHPMSRPPALDSLDFVKGERDNTLLEALSVG